MDPPRGDGATHAPVPLKTASSTTRCPAPPAVQVLYHQDEELEDLAYDTDDAGGMASTFHDMAPLESRGAWARFW